MSIIPEILIQRVLINGFRKVKEDPRIIDNLFMNLDQRDLAKAKAFLTKSTIHCLLNFPKEEKLSVPALVIQLQAESESEQFLGDMLGGSTNYRYPDQEIAVDTLGGHGASISDSHNLPHRYVEQFEVLGSGASFVEYDPEDQMGLADAVVAQQTTDLDLYVVSGTGVGQVRRIKFIDWHNNTIDIEGEFSTLLDSTSVIDIRDIDNPLAADGTPSRVYDTDHYVEKLGVNYEVRYSISVVAGTQWEVLYLYAILKALLISQREYLEAQGLQSLILSGNEFSPKGEYLPDITYERRLTLAFRYTFGFINIPETFTKIDFGIIPMDNTGPGEVIDGTIDLNG